MKITGPAVRRTAAQQLSLVSKTCAEGCGIRRLGKRQACHQHKKYYGDRTAGKKPLCFHFFSIIDTERLKYFT